MLKQGGNNIKILYSVLLAVGLGLFLVGSGIIHRAETEEEEIRGLKFHLTGMVFIVIPVAIIGLQSAFHLLQNPKSLEEADITDWIWMVMGVVSVMEGIHIISKIEKFRDKD